MAAAMLLDSLPSGDIEMHANVSGSDFEGWETSMEAEGDVQTEATEEVDMYDADDDTLDLDTYEMAEDSALQPEYLDDDVEFYDASPHNDPPLNEFEEEEDSPVLDLTDTTTVNTDHLVHTDAAAENDLDVSLDPAVAAETIEQDIYSTHLTHDPETLVPLEGPWVVEHIPADQELATEAVHLPLDHKDNQPILSSQPDLGPVSTLEQPLATIVSENLVVPAEHVAGENLPPPAETHEAALSELDPHEIDDGIYIDPPPAVLLRLPSESSEVYLFNQPIASGSGTSTPSSSRASPHPFPVLLQPLPTLYYEPISSLLESLRLESAVTSLPDVGSSELAIEAIDLKLSVTEDNIHAREVSLHDLNVLHDGSGLSGPLRLRLYLLTPRFILRYRALEREVNTLLLEEPTRADEGDQNQDLENRTDIHQHEDFENFQPPQNESTNENDIPNTDEEPSSITVDGTASHHLRRTRP
ncbi:hypothetical protein DL96DRAFT_1599010 [Flagelloscypha sp. PMI_526]|nr:hypothetical protein DL96DRAFT_1599010 [Flagelloscypha sp. PMI_526]